MNPPERFVNDFKMLFPDATIVLAEENNEYVIYHNVDINEINHSDKCAFDHICEVFSQSGNEYWLNFMETSKK